MPTSVTFATQWVDPFLPFVIMRGMPGVRALLPNEHTLCTRSRSLEAILGLPMSLLGPAAAAAVSQSPGQTRRIKYKERT